MASSAKEGDMDEVVATIEIQHHRVKSMPAKQRVQKQYAKKLQTLKISLAAMLLTVNQQAAFLMAQDTATADAASDTPD
jgi:hypothetical protein